MVRRESTCSVKVRYASEAEAQQAAERQMLMHMGLELRTYQCPYCNNWHLTRNREQ
ncbi:MAG TPA: hypothetical protein VFZ48_00215 [Candidatus Saccharimonadales bacterium]